MVALGFVARPGQAKVEFEVGARLGYAAPSGKLNDEPPTTDAMQTTVWDNELKSVVLGQVPLGLELGIRALPMLTLGGYVELAPGILGSTASDGCDAYDHDCSTLGIRFGFMGHVHVLPHQPIDPWLGVGVGFEALTLKEELTSRIAITLAYTGVEVPLRAGVDFKLNEKFYLGPYVGYTFGKFYGVSLSCEGADDCPDEESRHIDKTAGHSWLGFGAKLTIIAY